MKTRLMGTRITNKLTTSLIVVLIQESFMIGSMSQKKEPARL